MIGIYTIGCGKAHNNNGQYKKWFNCSMYSTFNVVVKGMPLEGITNFAYAKRIQDPTIVAKICDHDKWHWFWLVRLDGKHYAWAYRWSGSSMSKHTLELVSKELLPDELKTRPFKVEILEKHQPADVKEWSEREWMNAWHQTFPWSPVKVDSSVQWNAIDHVCWPGMTVLDIGCNFGYHCFRASRSGAIVTGFDTSPKAIEIAKIINDYIDQDDVSFSMEDPGGEYDYIFYFSVHHQEDPNYRKLESYLDELKNRARVSLFVELIMPSYFGGDKTEADVDRIVGGQILTTYKHKVRGNRRIYEVART